MSEKTRLLITAKTSLQAVLNKCHSSRLLGDLFYMKTSQYRLSNKDLFPDKSYIYMCFPRLINEVDLTYLAMEHSVGYSTLFSTSFSNSFFISRDQPKNNGDKLAANGWLGKSCNFICN